MLSSTISAGSILLGACGCREGRLHYATFGYVYSLISPPSRWRRWTTPSSSGVRGAIRPAGGAWSRPKHAGHRLAVSAPPRTRTPNPRIKSPNPVISCWFGACRLVSFLQVSDESLCRPVSARTVHLHGHRAPIEHRGRQPVLERRTRWGSGEGLEAADFPSARPASPAGRAQAPSSLPHRAGPRAPTPDR
jgi:hypothetical protein